MRRSGPVIKYSFFLFSWTLLVISVKDSFSSSLLFLSSCCSVCEMVGDTILALLMHSLIVFDLLLILFWFHVSSISANIKYKSDLWDRILQRTPLTERLFKHFYQRRVIKPIFKKQQTLLTTVTLTKSWLKNTLNETIEFDKGMTTTRPGSKKIANRSSTEVVIRCFKGFKLNTEKLWLFFILFRVVFR